MRARRRDREHVAGNSTGDGNRKGAGSGNRGGSGGGGGGGGKRNPRKRNRNRNRGGGGGGGGNKGGQAPAGAGFWGDKERLPEPRQDVRITDDPAAVARSLGAPPLPGHEKIAEHYFTVVYERAVQTAGALAAAGGLIDPEALTAELGD
jgi:hypothetical protein